MKTLTMTLAILSVLCGVCITSGVAQIRDVKKIYLASFGDEISADLIREKIRSRLINSGRFVVVEKRAEADAVLTGITDLERVEDGSISGVGRKGGGGIWGSTNTDFNAIGVFRLIHPEAKTTLWIYDYKPKWYRFDSGSNKANSEYNRIAKRVVEQLMKDADGTEKPKSSGGK